MGRLVADPELKTTNSGISVCSFRIAVDRNYVKAGEQRQADFFDVVAWRGSAEFVCKHFSKGSLIAVDGQLQSRNYQTKDGQNRTAIEVQADNISFTGERKDNPPVGQQSTPPQFEQPYARQQYMTERKVQCTAPNDYDLYPDYEVPGSNGDLYD
jgi:single-strand DNA-binding protein